ncbi:MAG: two-component system LytT family sensor kinase [Bacteroidia bacterium]|jgi:two-component system LytT family sensor kinase
MSLVEKKYNEQVFNLYLNEHLENMLVQPLKKSKKLITQVFLWLGLFVLLALLMSVREGLSHGINMSFFMTFGYGLIIYINSQWLMPEYFYNKKHTSYILFCIGLFILVYGYFYFIHTQILPIDRPDFKYREFAANRPQFSMRQFFPPFVEMMIGVLLFMTSIAYKSSQLALKKEKEAFLLKNENLDTELKFLRSQINPHFLFNALHNIYTLSLIKSDKTSEMIIMLSDMLRFMLYDCKKEKVMINKEVDYLKNFIALSKLKDHRIKNINTEFNIQKEDLLIEPMLFIPFLENSFKHSKIEDLEKGWISLKMKTTSDRVAFELSNSIPNTEFTKDDIGGIGLENVKRRLALLYPDNHELSINMTADRFSVKLNLLV